MLAIGSAVIGPTTTAFPLNDGWYIGDEPKKPSGEDRRLSELTIHEMTQFFTRRITDGVRPNCEKNWNVSKQGRSDCSR